jgi:isoleucyl-tRNA synthetase
MPPCPIDDAGRFTKEVPDFEGMHVKVSGEGLSNRARGYDKQDLI